jgi:hypothetical protein
MSIKFSVGVSEEIEDRLLLEQRRSSPDWLGVSGEAELQARPPGWPPSRVGAEEEAGEPGPPLWAW